MIRLANEDFESPLPLEDPNTFFNEGARYSSVHLFSRTLSTVAVTSSTQDYNLCGLKHYRREHVSSFVASSGQGCISNKKKKKSCSSK